MSDLDDAITAAKAGGSAVGGSFSATSPLFGLNPDVSYRLQVEELATVDLKLQELGVNQADRCIIGAVLGGGIEIPSWEIWKNSANSPQTVCKTDVTFDEAMQRLQALNVTLYTFLLAKSKASQTVAKQQDAAATKKLYVEEVGDIGAGAKKAAEYVETTAGKVVDTTLGLADALPWVILGLGTLVIGGAIIYLSMEEEA